MNLSDRNIKAPPFAIARRDGTTLTCQIEDGFRQAIETGFYQDGDFIPGYFELTRIFGVSIIIVRRALARLVADGLFLPQRGVGLRVCSKSPAKVGNVLVVIGGDAASYRYYMASLAEHLRRHLAKNHFSMTRAIVAGRDGREDFSELREALNRHVNLVVLLDYSKGTEKIVADAGVPYILVSPAPRSRKAAGYLKGDTAGAAAQIAGHCAACGARRVLLAEQGKEAGQHIVVTELETALRGLGMETRRIAVRIEQRNGNTALLLRAALDDFSRFCAKGRMEVDGYCPDMIVFLDDYVAQGALLAMTAAGIRIPEDVQVVTMANKGLGPNWLKPLTRYEVDAAAEAEILSDLILRCFRDHGRRHTAMTSTTFIAGETTRPLEDRTEPKEAS